MYDDDDDHDHDHEDREDIREAINRKGVPRDSDNASDVCPSVCRQNAYQKRIFDNKLSSLELWSLLSTYMGFSKNPLLNPKNSR